MLDFTKRNFITKQFLLFLIIGGINTFNGTLLSFGFSLFLQANVAFVLGYILANMIAYLLNSFFVFNSKPEIYKYIKFAISYVPNFIIQSVIVLIIYNILQLHQLIAYVIAAIIGVPITFLIVKRFAFGKNDAEIL